MSLQSLKCEFGLGVTIGGEKPRKGGAQVVEHSDTGDKTDNRGMGYTARRWLLLLARHRSIRTKRYWYLKARSWQLGFVLERIDKRSFLQNADDGQYGSWTGGSCTWVLPYRVVDRT